MGILWNQSFPGRPKAPRDPFKWFKNKAQMLKHHPGPPRALQTAPSGRESDGNLMSIRWNLDGISLPSCMIISALRKIKWLYLSAFSVGKCLLGNIMCLFMKNGHAAHQWKPVRYKWDGRASSSLSKSFAWPPSLHKQICKTYGKACSIECTFTQTKNMTIICDVSH